MYCSGGITAENGWAAGPAVKDYDSGPFEGCERVHTFGTAQRSN